MSPPFRVGTVLVAGAAAAGCWVSVDSQGQMLREQKRFAVQGTPPEVHLKTFDGGIQIQSWDRREVVIEIEKRGETREAIEQLVVDSTQNGNRIELEVRAPRTERFGGFGMNVSPSARLTVSVPHSVNLVARTGDGAIQADRLNGRLELHTGDGAIRAGDVAGDVRLTTGDGSITVDRVEGRLLVDTGDGGVNISGKLSAVRMHTGDGSIVYRIEPGAAMTEDWDISTGDGSVTLHVPPAFDAELDALTGDGAVRNELKTTSAANTEPDGRALRARLGDGGRRLRIRSGDGSISLRLR